MDGDYLAQKHPLSTPLRELDSLIPGGISGGAAQGKVLSTPLRELDSLIHSLLDFTGNFLQLSTPLRELDSLILAISRD